jgi:hypothetical protein
MSVKAKILTDEKWAKIEPLISERRKNPKEAAGQTKDATQASDRRQGP